MSKNINSMFISLFSIILIFLFYLNTRPDFTQSFYIPLGMSFIIYLIFLADRRSITEENIRIIESFGENLNIKNNDKKDNKINNIENNLENVNENLEENRV
jgi:uncharacterized membrane protein